MADHYDADVDDELYQLGLGERGRRLWRALRDATAADPAARTLLEETCRLADRLERLDEMLRGDPHTWAEVTLPTTGDVLVLRIDAALSEARLHTTALRGLVARLGIGRADAPDAPAEESLVDELARARAAREAAP